MGILYRPLLLAAAAFLIWRALASGFGDHFAQRTASPEESNAAGAIAWAGARPETLERLAATVRADDPERAAALYEAAFLEDPARANPLISVAERTEGLWTRDSPTGTQGAEEGPNAPPIEGAVSTEAASGAEPDAAVANVDASQQLTDAPGDAGLPGTPVETPTPVDLESSSGVGQVTASPGVEPAAPVDNAPDAMDAAAGAIEQRSDSTPGTEVAAVGIPAEQASGELDPVPTDSATDVVRSDWLVQRAARLEPANADIRIRAAIYWLRRGDLERALAEWSAALDANSDRFETLFPVLLKIAEHPDTRAALNPYVVQPPTWWDRFFDRMAIQALDLDTVRYVYTQRRESGGAPISAVERQAYIARLQREGRSTEAYLSWVNGLSDTEREQLGLIFNGGFELAPTGTGFDWHIGGSRGEKVDTAATYGTEGERALHLLFSNTQEPFRRFFQPLFIDPGRYRVTGQVRTDGLKTNGGLQWSVECRADDKTFSLATSERFLGSQQWRPFEFELELPSGCTDPTLRLSTYARVQSDYRISGSAWFDDLRMQRLAPAVSAESQPTAEAQAATADRTK